MDSILCLFTCTNAEEGLETFGVSLCSIQHLIHWRAELVTSFAVVVVPNDVFVLANAAP